MSNHSYTEQLHKAAQQLRDPFRFRIFVTIIALGLACFLVHTPLHGTIEESKRMLHQEQRLAMLSQDVEFLRAQMEFFEGRLVKDSDVNEWIEYVLNGVRALPLKLINLDLEDERKVGLYRAVGLRLEVSGEMKSLDALLHWLETNERMFRVNAINLNPAREQETHRVMQLTVLGLKG